MTDAYYSFYCNNRASITLCARKSWMQSELYSKELEVIDLCIIIVIYTPLYQIM